MEQVEPTPIPEIEAQPPHILDIMSNDDVMAGCVHTLLAFRAFARRRSEILPDFIDAFEKAKRHAISNMGDPLHIALHIKWIKDFGRHLNARDELNYIGKRVEKYLNENDSSFVVLMGNIINRFDLDGMERRIEGMKDEIPKDQLDFNLKGVELMRKIHGFVCNENNPNHHRIRL